MLTPFVLLLAALVSAAVLKSRPQEVQMARIQIPVPTTAASGWHPSVPMCERFESATLLPYHHAERTVQLVEVSGGRRELLYREVKQ